MPGLFHDLPRHVDVYEVSPRDGLQNESRVLSTDDKLRLIAALVDSGVKRIEVTSFVSPKWIPQLADADELLRRLPRVGGVVYSALCPNEKGLDRALAGGIGEIGVFMSASETHNKKNVNKSIAESLELAGRLVPSALASGLRVRAYVSAVWGCPYEGEVSVDRVLEVAERHLELGAYEVSLGDTIGVGNPLQTRRILERLLARLPKERLAMHMHDTRGTALANCLVGLEHGITVFDASIGGIGGCPYAPGAAGNLATEDLVNMLDGMGIESGIRLDALWRAGQVARDAVGHELPGKVHKAGVSSIRA